MTVQHHRNGTKSQICTNTLAAQKFILSGFIHRYGIVVPDPTYHILETHFSPDAVGAFHEAS